MCWVGANVGWPEMMSLFPSVRGGSEFEWTGREWDESGGDESESEEHMVGTS